MKHPEFHAPSGFCEGPGRLVGHVLGIVVGFGFGGWDSAEAVHEALLVVQGDVIGSDEFDVAQGVQWAAAKRGIRPDALVLVESDRGLGQSIIVGIADTADGGPDTRKGKFFTESHARILRSGIRVKPISV